MSLYPPTIKLVEGLNLYLEHNGHLVKVCGIQKGGGIRIMPLNGGIKDRPRVVPLGQLQVRMTGTDGSTEKFDERLVTTCVEIEPLGLHWRGDEGRYTGGKK